MQNTFEQLYQGVIRDCHSVVRQYLATKGLEVPENLAQVSLEQLQELVLAHKQGVTEAPEETTVAASTVRALSTVVAPKALGQPVRIAEDRVIQLCWLLAAADRLANCSGTIKEKKLVLDQVLQELEHLMNPRAANIQFTYGTQQHSVAPFEQASHVASRGAAGLLTVVGLYTVAQRCQADLTNLVQHILCPNGLQDKIQALGLAYTTALEGQLGLPNVEEQAIKAHLHALVDAGDFAKLEQVAKMCNEGRITEILSITRAPQAT